MGGPTHRLSSNISSHHSKLEKKKRKKEKKQEEEEEEEEVSAATHAIDVGQLFEARGNCKAKEYSLNNCSKQSTQHKNLNSLCY